MVFFCVCFGSIYTPSCCCFPSLWVRTSITSVCPRPATSPFAACFNPRIPRSLCLIIMCLYPRVLSVLCVSCLIKCFYVQADLESFWIRPYSELDTAHVNIPGFGCSQTDLFQMKPFFDQDMWDLPVLWLYSGHWSSCFSCYSQQKKVDEWDTHHYINQKYAWLPVNRNISEILIWMCTGNIDTI